MNSLANPQFDLLGVGTVNSVLAVCTVVCCLGVVLSLLRIYTKWAYYRIQWDDRFMAIALVRLTFDALRVLSPLTNTQIFFIVYSVTATIGAKDIQRQKNFTRSIVNHGIDVGPRQGLNDSLLTDMHSSLMFRKLFTD
jgi:hypothetical protein